MNFKQKTGRNILKAAYNIPFENLLLYFNVSFKILEKIQ